MRQPAPHVPRARRLIASGTLVLLATLAACAHTQPVDDADLSGRWEGPVTAQGRGGDQTFGLRLDLVVAQGQVTGTGEMLSTSAGREGRPVQVRGEFQGRRAFLTIEPDGLRPHILRVILTEADQLEGSFEVELPGGARPAPGAGSPARVVLTRTRS